MGGKSPWLTRIPRISRIFLWVGNLLASHRSHGFHGFFCGWEISLAHTDLTDLTGFSFVGGKSHGCSPPVCSKGSHSPCLTQIPRISQGFPLWVRNLTEVGGKGVWGCRSAPSALSAPIYQSSHGFNRFNKKIFVRFVGFVVWNYFFWGKWWGNRQKVRNFTF